MVGTQHGWPRVTRQRATMTWKAGLYAAPNCPYAQFELVKPVPSISLSISRQRGKQRNERRDEQWDRRDMQGRWDRRAARFFR